MSNNSSLWCEKYRPDKLENYIGNDAMKKKVASYIETGDVPHLLLVGPPGTGKTTAAKIIMNTIDCDRSILNASDENNIETVRGKIRNFASTRGFAPMKIMVLDEFDGFTQAGQMALRNLMEQFSDTTRFILTANHIERIADPIISRTQQFKVVPPSKREVAIHVAGILKKESVTFKPVDLKLIIDAHFPDIRKIINELQLAAHNGVLEVDTKQVIDSDAKLKIVAELTGAGTYETIRQLIANAQLRDFTDLYRVFYDRVTDYAKGQQIPQVILTLAEAQFRDASVIDKEINMIACIINILEIIR